MPGTPTTGTGGETPADTGSATSLARSRGPRLVGWWTVIDFDAIPRRRASVESGDAVSIGIHGAEQEVVGVDELLDRRPSGTLHRGVWMLLHHLPPEG